MVEGSARTADSVCTLRSKQNLWYALASTCDVSDFRAAISYKGTSSKPLVSACGRMELASSMTRMNLVWGMRKWLSLPTKCLIGLIICFQLIQSNKQRFLMSKKAASNSNGTQLLRPKNQKRTEVKVQNKQEKEKEEQTMPKKGGVRIGDSTESDKWRCVTCKRLNPLETEQCSFCGDPKTLSVKAKIEQKKG